MNTMIQQMAYEAATATGVNLMAQDPAFVNALAEMIVARCAQLAEDGDSYQTYNLGVEIREAFGLTS
jgi:hypothetical protein